MPAPPYYAQLSADGIGRRYVDQPAWDSVIGAFYEWPGHVNASQKNLSNLGVLTFGTGGYISGYVGIGTANAIARAHVFDQDGLVASLGGYQIPLLIDAFKTAPADANYAGSIYFRLKGQSGYVRSKAAIIWRNHPASDGYGRLQFAVNDDLNDPKIQMTIVPGGVGIGMEPAYQFQLSSDSAAKPTSSTWTVASDARLKSSVRTMEEDSLAVISKLRFVRGEYNGLAGTPKGQALLGLVAQEARVHMPEAVRTFRTKLHEADAEDTELLGVDYHALILHSARAIQQIGERLADKGGKHMPAAPNDAALAQQEAQLYVDEAAKALFMRYRDSGGVLHTATLGSWE